MYIGRAEEGNRVALLHFSFMTFNKILKLSLSQFLHLWKKRIIIGLREMRNVSIYLGLFLSLSFPSTLSVNKHFWVPSKRQSAYKLGSIPNAPYLEHTGYICLENNYFWFVIIFNPEIFQFILLLNHSHMFYLQLLCISSASKRCGRMAWAL